MEQAIALLREFGFPIFVCLWFMWRMEKKFDKSMEQQARLILAITILCTAMDVDLPESAMLPRTRSKELKPA